MGTTYLLERVEGKRGLSDLLRVLYLLFFKVRNGGLIGLLLSYKARC